MASVRAVVQRVREASVRVDRTVVGAIDHGLVVLLGVGAADTPREAEALCEKIVALRIFAGDDGKFARALADVGGALLVVSQFTLYGDTSRGRRPSFGAAAPPERARALYEHFVAHARGRALRVETGVFQAHMDVALVNDGPVTLVVDAEPAAA